MGALSIKRGTKMQLAKEAAVGQQPVFNMISTFNKELDESTFLVSIPRMDGKLWRMQTGPISDWEAGIINLSGMEKRKMWQWRQPQGNWHVLYGEWWQIISAIGWHRYTIAICQSSWQKSLHNSHVRSTKLQALIRKESGFAAFKRCYIRENKKQFINYL